MNAHVLNADDPQTSLRSTLFALASLRPGEMGTGDEEKLKIHKCPNCEEGPITVEDIPDQQYCPYCQKEVYPIGLSAPLGRSQRFSIQPGRNLKINDDP